MANEYMDDGDCIPPFLYPLEAIQKARQNVKSKGLRKPKGIRLFDSLSLIAENVEFKNYIKRIGYDMFYVMYWSNAQVDLFRDMQPYSTITDKGKAIQNAACIVFNKITYIMYIDTCLLILLNKCTHIQLQTQIRKDIADFIYLVTKSSCFDKASVFIIPGTIYYDDECKIAMDFVIARISIFEFDWNTSMDLQH